MASPFFRGTTKGSKSYIRGEAEWYDNMRRIVAETNGKLLERALLSASEPIRDDASELAPVETGLLSRSITQEVLETTATRTHIVIGPGEEAFYGLFLELGSNPHAGAEPFLRPAFDMNKRKIGKNMRADIWDAIRGAVKRVV